MLSNQGMRAGIQGGLLAGTTVIVTFLLFDLARLKPLATPFALVDRLLWTTSPVLEAPVISRLVAVGMLAGNLAALTIIHFMAFSVLGVGAVWGCEECRVPLNVGTGAVYGLAVGSLAYSFGMVVFGSQVIAQGPDAWAVGSANLLAGAVMGGFYQIRRLQLSR